MNFVFELLPMLLIIGLLMLYERRTGQDPTKGTHSDVDDYLRRQKKTGKKRGKKSKVWDW